MRSSRLGDFDTSIPAPLFREADFRRRSRFPLLHNLTAVLSKMRDPTSHLDRGVERFCNADHDRGAEDPEDVVDEQAALTQGMEGQTDKLSASPKLPLIQSIRVADTDTSCLHWCRKDASSQTFPSGFDDLPASLLGRSLVCLIARRLSVIAASI
jgi:hypothetical protein